MIKSPFERDSVRQKSHCPNSLLKRSIATFLLVIAAHVTYSQAIHSIPDYISLLPREAFVVQQLYALRFQVNQELKKKSEADKVIAGEACDSLIRLSVQYGFPAFEAEGYLMLGQVHDNVRDREMSRSYYKLAMQKAAGNGDSLVLAKAFRWYGWSMIFGNHYDTAIAYTIAAKSIAAKLGHKVVFIDVCKNLPRLYYLREDFVNAYKESMALVAVGDSIGEKGARIYGLHLMSDLAGMMNLRVKQKDLIYSLLKEAKHSTDSQSLYTIYNTAYQGCLNSGQYDSSLYYAKMVNRYTDKLYIHSAGLDKLAKSHFELGNLDSARYFYHQAIAENIRTNTYIDPYKYLDLGMIEFQDGNYREAIIYLKLAESNINNVVLFTRKRIYKALYDYYKHFNQFALATSYLESYAEVVDKIQASQAGIVLLQEEDTRYQSQIAVLSKDNELQVAKVQKQRLQNRVGYGATAIILLMVGGAFYRQKQQRELKSKAALATERLRISRELHDEIGSTLSGIALYSHVAKEQMRCEDSAGAIDSLTLMQGSATEMVKKLSDIVWLINPERDTIAELFDRLELYARQMGAARKMAVRIDMTPQLADLHIPLEVRRNIYLFCKEAINNAVKYSNGSFIELNVQKAGGHVRFSVRDDGDGFDEMTVRHGNGLRNMVKRAEAIGALCQINTRPNHGAHIEMQYKLIH